MRGNDCGRTGTAAGLGKGEGAFNAGTENANGSRNSSSSLGETLAVLSVDP